MMTDDLSMQTCPKCGKENLTHMTHCVHCGNELEDLFSFDGQIELPDDENKDEPISNLPLFLEEMSNQTNLIDEDDSGSDDDGEASPKSDPNAPDWLARVRERVRAEEDASGELTKGLKVIEEKLEDDNKEDSEKQYQAWLDEVRKDAEAEEEKRARRLRPSPVDDQGVPEWLRRIRALHPKEGETDEDDETFDEWTEEELEALRRQELGDDYVEESEPIEELEEDEPESDEKIVHNIPEDDEDLLPDREEKQNEATPATDATEAEQEALSDDSQFVLLSETKLKAEEVFNTDALDGLLENTDDAKDEKAERKARAKEKEAIIQDLLILRGQHEKVALLKTLISDESRPPRTTGKTAEPKMTWTRLIIGLAVIGLLLLAILFLPSGTAENPLPSMPQLRFARYLDGITPDKQVLLVMSYYSASASELEALAAPVLKQLNEKGIDWQAITLRMDGLWLAESLYKKAGLYDKMGLNTARLPVFLAGGQFAMLDMAINQKDKPAQSLLQENLPQLEDFDYVLLLTDSSLTVRGWLEQVAPNQDSLYTLAIVSQKEAVAIQPYFYSGQILAYLSGNQGLPDTETQAVLNQNVYKAGMAIILVLFVIAVFYNAKHGRLERPEIEVSK